MPRSVAVIGNLNVQWPTSWSSLTEDGRTSENTGDARVE